MDSEQTSISRLALNGALLAGLMMLALVVAMLIVTPMQVAWMPEGFLTPLYALEFVTDYATARHMLGHEPAVAMAFIQGIQVDMVFLVVYGVFLVCSVFVLLEKGVLRYIALFFALLAPAGDFFENLQLLSLLKSIAEATGFHDVADVNFTYLRLAVVVKFGAIAIVMLRLLRPLWLRARMGQALSLLIFINTLATGASFFHVPYAVEVMVNTISLCWFLLWIILLMQWRAKTTSNAGKLLS